MYMQRRVFLTSLGLGAIGGVAAAKNDFAKPVPPPPSGIALFERWRHALAGARLYEITRLREYSATGRFPKNHRIFGHTPVFIDEHDTHCAVGYLMRVSGHGFVADQIKKTNNHVYIEKIDGGRALDWILYSGLTQAECAEIQPSYKHERHIERNEGRITEQAQLRAHFAAVEQRLIANTNKSLDAAVDRLAPRIKAGADIDHVIH
jgi:hypothetical protein